MFDSLYKRSIVYINHKSVMVDSLYKRSIVYINHKSVMVDSLLNVLLFILITSQSWLTLC